MALLLDGGAARMGAEWSLPGSGWGGAFHARFLPASSLVWGQRASSVSSAAMRRGLNLSGFTYQLVGSTPFS